MKSLPAVALVVCVLLAGCTDPFSVSEGSVTVSSEPGFIRVENHSAGLDVVHVLLEKQTSFVVGLAPCESWSSRTGPGSVTITQNESVAGYHAEADSAVVYWCTLDGSTITENGGATLPFR